MTGLIEFRRLAKKASRAAELVPLINRELLEDAGFTVHADSRNFLGATRTDTKKRKHVELRIGRANLTIGGTVAVLPPERSRLEWAVDSFALAMSDGPLDAPAARITSHHELPWQDLVGLI